MLIMQEFVGKRTLHMNKKFKKKNNILPSQCL